MIHKKVFYVYFLNKKINVMYCNKNVIHIMNKLGVETFYNICLLVTFINDNKQMATNKYFIV